ncbi:MAG TPA: bifunctional (p)ppGpp synthetase/guanosine-3',5'-bis(diphosphate) 3'-pyrophosphohydrolase [Gammaproteobacteria bacterium]|nr:bifunctional (p)ppGpp synthetase/guanosine-3',5'-bis(diphosphate) 3'-pyrophosphohydrolase [Gammaproteobacteria bacterium]
MNHNDADTQEAATNLVDRARIYATKAHQRINHRRKYSNQPYHVHLEAIVKLLQQVTDDAEILAAAWLHDTVEDTPATLDNIEQEFGQNVAELVEDLTDVSLPSDGNRAVRKEIDLKHLAQASTRAKTIKLADLIDNARDITKHDPRFAVVFLEEMNALLEILDDGHPSLLEQAHRVYAKSITKIKSAHIEPDESAGTQVELASMIGLSGPQLRRMFSDIFTARDIAETLLSFDAGSPTKLAQRTLKKKQYDVASLRINGTVEGYIRSKDLTGELCSEHIRHFAPDQVIRGDARLTEVIHVLTRHEYCFLSQIGDINGVICRDDINKPIVRMWLFGMITLSEMTYLNLIRKYFPGDSWHKHVSDGRLAKAKGIHAERQRRNQHSNLLECLQLSDKGQILIDRQETLEILGFDSRRTAKRVMKELESLRNHLAHTQDIASHDWAQIARMTRRLESINSELSNTAYQGSIAI